AAFLLFLKQEKPLTFGAELTALRHERDFETWVLRRLQNAGLRNVFAAAAVLAACEFPVTRFDELARAHGGSPDDSRRVLVGDKWIERREPLELGGEPIWAVFHDVFADV